MNKQDRARDTAGSGREADIDWLTLSFPKELEDEFRRDYALKSVRHVRFGIGLAIALWSLFGLLDPWIVPEVKWAVWTIRFAFVVPSLVLIFLFTFAGSFHRFAQEAAAAVFMISVLALIVMVNWVIRPSDPHPYTAGLLLAVPCGCVIWRMRFINGVWAALSAVLLDNIAAVWLTDIPPAVIANNNFFLVSAILLGLVAGYNMETYIRRDFLQRRAAEKSIDQLNALREIGQSVGSTLDLEAVLTTIVTHAVELSGASGGAIYEYDEATQAFHLRTSHGLEAELVEVLRAAPIPRNQGAIGRAVAELRPIQIPDILETPDLILARARPVLERLGHRSLLALPLRREQRIFGGLVVSRRQVGSLPPETVNLLETFAAQSGLAIHNARLFRETDEKSRQLELANLARSRFLAAASHDLRQPLHTLSLYSAALKLHAPDGATGEIARHINKALASLSALVDSLLDISKLDAGAVEPEPQSVSLRTLIERIEADYRPLANGKGLEFHVNAPDILMQTDPVLFERLVRNLVDNAFKYTAAGNVTLDAQVEGGKVRISVRDTGPGIPPAERERIFEEFYQIGNPERDRVQGLGLGLAIVQRISQLLGLELKLESEPGRGSTFTVTAPLAMERRAVPRAPAAPAAPDETAPRALEGARVLVIDDEPDVRAGMRALLEQLGCRVAVCSGYTDAARLIDQDGLEDIHMIVSDFRLRQHENGIDTVRRLRARLGQVPALLVSGDTAPERLREAQSSGLPLLHKPVSADKLMEAMLAALRR
ncbi:MAG TPA: hybrid sensor histidine kinase/response regulator [Burkholderiales bacterium]|nr:hybrid sensor histidine kinase/response regulator [Burkholderiales bacterium]